MEARAIARYIRMSPRKVRLIVNLIKGKDLETALNILQFSPQAAAKAVEKVVDSAVNNAISKDKELDVDRLYIHYAKVDMGPTMKRFRPRAMGRAMQILKRTSHITVVLRDRDLPKKEAEEKETAKAGGKKVAKRSKKKVAKKPSNRTGKTKAKAVKGGKSGSKS